MKTFGLIGYRLGHSFSKDFFMTKFKEEDIKDHEYVNFELDSIDRFPLIFERNNHIYGLNCTIPYKQEVIPFLYKISKEAAQVGAVNTIKVVHMPEGIKLKGYNTDVYGFEKSFRPLIGKYHKQALILGTGGASRAVKYVLKKLGIRYLSGTTKQHTSDLEIPYEDIDATLLNKHLIVINTTPLGMFPDIDTCPDIPYEALTADHLLYDLVYNPEETLFLKKGREQGATVKNGLDMLRFQALKSWDIWNS